MGEVSAGGPVSLSRLGGGTGCRTAVGSAGLVDALPAPRRRPSLPVSVLRGVPYSEAGPWDTVCLRLRRVYGL